MEWAQEFDCRCKGRNVRCIYCGGIGTLTRTIQTRATKTLADMTHAERLVAIAKKIHLPESIALIDECLELMRIEREEIEAVAIARLRDEH